MTTPERTLCWVYGLIALAALVFMVADGRRIGLPRLWVYVALVFLVAVSVAFPLYLIGRTRHLTSLRVGLPGPLSDEPYPSAEF